MEAPTDGTIRLPVVLRFVDLATDALAEAREEIDALNVYPVPDGDTGTNMYLTVSAARDALRDVVLGDPSADLAATRWAKAPSISLRMTPLLPRAPSSAPRRNAWRPAARSAEGSPSTTSRSASRAAETVRYLLVPVSPSVTG